MIICKTPYRISFFGGGSDYNAYFEENRGSVLVSTINKYCYISLRELPPFFEQKHRIAWSRIENVNEIDEIRHPSVRECLRFMGIQDGLSVTHDGDLPARAGMGSSSAFTVGLLNALYAYRGELIDKYKLSQNAIYVEQEMIKEAVGCQDQISTCYGGINRIYFDKTGFTVRPVFIKEESQKKFENSLMLFFTGFSRIASEIALEQIKTMRRNMSDVSEMARMADEGERLLLTSGGVREFGRLMDTAWKIKRGLTDKISTARIDEIYETAIKNGAYGGKLLGAGGGGFMLFVAEEESRSRIKEALKGLIHIPFEFEYSGTHITHYTPR